MTDALVPQARPDSSRSATVGRLFVLELSGGRIHSMNADGSDRKVIVTGCEMPDGIAVDVAAGHIYWTNMGTSPGNERRLHRACRSRRRQPEGHRAARCHLHAQADPAR